jgi:hypothetical protein
MAIIFGFVKVGDAVCVSAAAFAVVAVLVSDALTGVPIDGVGIGVGAGVCDLLLLICVVLELLQDVVDGGAIIAMLGIEL